jgi:hypothetical protein
MRPGQLALVVAAAVAAAFLASRLLRPAAEPGAPAPGPQAPAELTVTGRASAAHLDYDARTRLEVAAQNLARMAGDLPERLGPIKEEIALLCDDDAVVAMIAAAFPDARRTGQYAVHAFADLFAAVRRPEFVGPSRELLLDPDRISRKKGVDAAVTQRDPSLMAPLLRAYESCLADPSTTLLTRATAVYAAVRTKGPEAGAVVQAALRDPAPEVVQKALEAAAELQWPGLDPDLRALFRETKDPRVKMRAAAALAARDPGARAHLFAALDPRDQGLAFEAAGRVIATKPPGGGDAARAFLDGAVGDVRDALRAVLGVYGDPAVLAEAREAASRPDTDDGVAACGLLARVGDPGAVEVLVAAVDRGGRAAGAIARGLSESGAAALMPVGERLLKIEVDHTALLDEFATRMGPGLVPAALREFEAATTDARRRYLVATIMGIGGPEARAALVGLRPRFARMVDPAIRLVDLALRAR